MRRFREGIINRRGNFPNLERPEPPKALGNPENLQSDIPAVKAAAEVKQLEDQEAQKIKSVKYLAKVGCGCDKGPYKQITDALFASLDDCSEEVRYATVTAISNAAADERCQKCKSSSCCDPKIMRRVRDLAFGRDEGGCLTEPSDRVRRVATEILSNCLPAVPEPEPQLIEPPPEVDDGKELPKKDASEEAEPKVERNARDSGDGSNTNGDGSQDETDSSTGPNETRNALLLNRPSNIRLLSAEMPHVASRPVSGVVAHVEIDARRVFVHFDGAPLLDTKSNVVISHHYLIGKPVQQHFRPVGFHGELVELAPIDSNRPWRIAKGDCARAFPTK